MEGHGGRALRRLEGSLDSAADTVRLFFALWPDDAARTALANLAGVLHAQCGGRQVPAGRIHLTLVFLGSVRASLVPALRQMAAATSGAGIELGLDAMEYRRRNGIVWIGASACPPALSTLEARLASGVRGLGLRTESRRYTPHVTLLRSARSGPQRPEFDTIEWRSAEFSLVRSGMRQGAVSYDVIGRWPLAGEK